MTDGDSTPASQAVAVVGAGLAGLTCAAELCAAGRDVTLIDKGRKPAGRMSSRRAPASAFDHGAQYFTARGEAFRERVQTWCERGLVAPWDGRIVALSQGRSEPTEAVERLVGVPTMSAIAGHLTDELVARGVRVVSGARVGSILSESGPESGSPRRWRLAEALPGKHLDGLPRPAPADGSTQDLGAYDHVAVALPAQQAAAILPAGDLRARAESVELLPCWAVMLAFDEPLEVDFDGAFCDGALSWAARNSSKPGRPAELDAWVLHGSPDWTGAHLGLEREAVVAELSRAFAEACGRSLPEVAHAAAHLWRFSIAAAPLEADAGGAFWDADSGLGLAGDWCAGSRVEGAWTSGRALARLMLADAAARREVAS